MSRIHRLPSRERPDSVPDLSKVHLTKKGYTVIGDPTTNPIRDHKLLAELRNYDDENHRLILKESKEYIFDTLPKAVFAKSQFWRFAMKKLGVMAVENFHTIEAQRRNMPEFERQLNKDFADKQIHIEERPPKFLNIEQDGWKSGMYVYYKGDIVYFISNPYSKRKFRNGIWIAGQVDFCLRTNAPNQLA